jgi:5'-3' exonuclease
MGVLEFFGTLIKNDITSTAIRPNFVERLPTNHLFLDFNSIVHVSSQKITLDINVFLQLVLKNLYANRSINNLIFTEKFEKYEMKHIQKQINQDTDPEIVIALFKEHFTQKYLDKLIITMVINTVLHIVRTYCVNKKLKTLLLAIDGVPSKGKMIEQRQRRYMGAIMEEYKRRILNQYKDYLLEQPDYIYIATKNSIKWNRNKITPGTGFMNKMVNYLNSEKIQAKFKINRPELEIIVSDMYEIGEGEKKIVNYVNKYLDGTDDSVVIYSPDADMILLCMLLPVKKLHMLRYNQQTFLYDLIDINMLKSNISYYINNNPNFSKEQFEINRINYDLVCISTLFGNDFVPKIETLNVKGFQNIMDAYLKTLIKLKDKGYYLVKRSDGQYKLNFVFLKCILKHLQPEEDDFIKHNKLYGQYIKIGQIKDVFDYMEINSENLVSIYNEYRYEYENLKNLIKNNGSYTYFETNDQFMSSLKKSINIIMDGQSVNITYLSNRDMIKLLQNYYRKYHDFPKLNINLNTYSHSITDPYHKVNVKDYNDYQKEIYKFDKMLDQYYVKFNAQPLNLTKDKIDQYYDTYFGVKLYDKNKNLTKEANQVMHDYLEGMLWVFDYYFNDPTYINRWYYHHERAPLIQHFSMFLNSIDLEYFTNVFSGLDKYHVKNLDSYFNPVEQLIYVSPMTKDVLKIIPSNYREYIESDDLDPFLVNYFVDINEIVDRLQEHSSSNEIDCRSIMFLNKCFIKSISKPTSSDDKEFLKAIRKVKPNTISKIRSQNTEPDY